MLFLLLLQFLALLCVALCAALFLPLLAAQRLGYIGGGWSLRADPLAGALVLEGLRVHPSLLARLLGPGVAAPGLAAPFRIVHARVRRVTLALSALGKKAAAAAPLLSLDGAELSLVGSCAVGGSAGWGEEGALLAAQRLRLTFAHAAAAAIEAEATAAAGNAAKATVAGGALSAGSLAATGWVALAQRATAALLGTLARANGGNGAKPVVAAQLSGARLHLSLPRRAAIVVDVPAAALRLQLNTPVTTATTPAGAWSLDADLEGLRARCLSATARNAKRLFNGGGGGSGVQRPTAGWDTMLRPTAARLSLSGTTAALSLPDGAELALDNAAAAQLGALRSLLLAHRRWLAAAVAADAARCAPLTGAQRAAYLKAVQPEEKGATTGGPSAGVRRALEGAMSHAEIVEMRLAAAGVKVPPLVTKGGRGKKGASGSNGGAGFSLSLSASAVALDLLAQDRRRAPLCLRATRATAQLKLGKVEAREGSGDRAKTAPEPRMLLPWLASLLDKCVLSASVMGDAAVFAPGVPLPLLLLAPHGSGAALTLSRAGRAAPLKVALGSVLACPSTTLVASMEFVLALLDNLIGTDGSGGDFTPKGAALPFARETALALAAATGAAAVSAEVETGSTADLAVAQLRVCFPATAPSGGAAAARPACGLLLECGAAASVSGRRLELQISDPLLQHCHIACGTTPTDTTIETETSTFAHALCEGAGSTLRLTCTVSAGGGYELDVSSPSALQLQLDATGWRALNAGTTGVAAMVAVLQRWRTAREAAVRRAAAVAEQRAVADAFAASFAQRLDEAADEAEAEHAAAAAAAADIAAEVEYPTALDFGAVQAVVREHLGASCLARPAPTASEARVEEMALMALMPATRSGDVAEADFRWAVSLFLRRLAHKGPLRAVALANFVGPPAHRPPDPVQPHTKRLWRKGAANALALAKKGKEKLGAGLSAAGKLGKARAERAKVAAATTKAGAATTGKPTPMTPTGGGDAADVDGTSASADGGEEAGVVQALFGTVESGRQSIAGAAEATANLGRSSLAWAASMLSPAVSNRLGLLEEEGGDTMFEDEEDDGVTDGGDSAAAAGGAQHTPQPSRRASSGNIARASTLSHTPALSDAEQEAQFWSELEEECGAVRGDLRGQSAVLIQQKMVRMLSDAALARQRWDKWVAPALLASAMQPAEAGGGSHGQLLVPWLLQPISSCGGASALNIVAQTHGGKANGDCSGVAAGCGGGSGVSLSGTIGDVTLRLLDPLLPQGAPRLELSLTGFTIGEAANASGAAAVSCEAALRSYAVSSGTVESLLEPFAAEALLLVDDSSSASGGDIVVRAREALHCNLSTQLHQQLRSSILAFEPPRLAPPATAALTGAAAVSTAVAAAPAGAVSSSSTFVLQNDTGTALTFRVAYEDAAPHNGTKRGARRKTAAVSVGAGESALCSVPDNGAAAAARLLVARRIDKCSALLAQHRAKQQRLGGRSGGGASDALVDAADAEALLRQVLGLSAKPLPPPGEAGEDELELLAMAAGLRQRGGARHAESALGAVGAHALLEAVAYHVPLLRPRTLLLAEEGTEGAAVYEGALLGACAAQVVPVAGALPDGDSPRLLLECVPVGADSGSAATRVVPTVIVRSGAELVNETGSALAVSFAGAGGALLGTAEVFAMAGGGRVAVPAALLASGGELLLRDAANVAAVPVRVAVSAAAVSVGNLGPGKAPLSLRPAGVGAAGYAVCARRLADASAFSGAAAATPATLRFSVLPALVLRNQSPFMLEYACAARSACPEYWLAQEDGGDHDDDDDDGSSLFAFSSGCGGELPSGGGVACCAEARLDEKTFLALRPQRRAVSATALATALAAAPAAATTAWPTPTALPPLAELGTAAHTLVVSLGVGGAGGRCNVRLCALVEPCAAAGCVRLTLYAPLLLLNHTGLRLRYRCYEEEGRDGAATTDAATADDRPSCLPMSDVAHRALFGASATAATALLPLSSATVSMRPVGLSGDSRGLARAPPSFFACSWSVPRRFTAEEGKGGGAFVGRAHQWEFAVEVQRLPVPLERSLCVTLRPALLLRNELRRPLEVAPWASDGRSPVLLQPGLVTATYQLLPPQQRQEQEQPLAAVRLAAASALGACEGDECGAELVLTVLAVRGVPPPVSAAAKTATRELSCSVTYAASGSSDAKQSTSTRPLLVDSTVAPKEDDGDDVGTAMDVCWNERLQWEEGSGSGAQVATAEAPRLIFELNERAASSVGAAAGGGSSSTAAAASAAEDGGGDDDADGSSTSLAIATAGMSAAALLSATRAGRGHPVRIALWGGGGTGSSSVELFVALRRAPRRIEAHGGGGWSPLRLPVAGGADGSGPRNSQFAWLSEMPPNDAAAAGEPLLLQCCAAEEGGEEQQAMLALSSADAAEVGAALNPCLRVENHTSSHVVSVEHGDDGSCAAAKSDRSIVPPLFWCDVPCPALGSAAAAQRLVVRVVGAGPRSSCVIDLRSLPGTAGSIAITEAVVAAPTPARGAKGGGDGSGGAGGGAARDPSKPKATLRAVMLWRGDARVLVLTELPEDSAAAPRQLGDGGSGEGAARGWLSAVAGAGAWRVHWRADAGGSCSVVDSLTGEQRRQISAPSLRARGSRVARDALQAMASVAAAATTTPAAACSDRAGGGGASASPAMRLAWPDGVLRPAACASFARTLVVHVLGGRSLPIGCDPLVEVSVLGRAPAEDGAADNPPFALMGEVHATTPQELTTDPVWSQTMKFPLGESADVQLKVAAFDNSARRATQLQLFAPAPRRRCLGSVCLSMLQLYAVFGATLTEQEWESSVVWFDLGEPDAGAIGLVCRFSPEA